MRNLARYSSLLIIASLPLAPVVAQPPSDETAIRQLVQQYVAVRENLDAHAIERLFTSDADQLVSSGEWRKGREAVVNGTLASSRKEAGHRTITIESVRFIVPEVALADGRYEITGLPSSQTRKMWTTLLCKREAGVWRIAAIRNMLPAPPVPLK